MKGGVIMFYTTKEERQQIAEREQKRIENLKQIKSRFLAELKHARLNNDDHEEVKAVLDRVIPNDWV